VDKSPDAFRTISEAADELDLPQHVLRFWESRFSAIKPLKRGGNRRYYRAEDVMLLKGVRHLLYEQGFTIKGVQKILKEFGARHVIAIGNGGSLEGLPSPANEPQDESSTGSQGPEDDRDVTPPSNIALNGDARQRLNNVLRDLLECKRLLERARE
jgi:DNA-binding transcriptional MerR regulator